jgi:hypothetical protein
MCAAYTENYDMVEIPDRIIFGMIETSKEKGRKIRCRN